MLPGSAVGRTVRITLPVAARSVPAARRFAVRACDRWGLSAVAPDVAALTSELATNAYLHGAGWFTVELTHDEQRVRVAATDDNRGLLERRNASPATRTTHALRVVAGIAAAWGTTTAGDRKTVWAEVAVPRSG